MSTGRTVKVFNTVTNSVSELVSSATTWGELKKEIIASYEASSVALDVDNMAAVAKLPNGRIELGFDDTPVPSVELKVYLYPEKSKSGVNMTVAYIKETRSKLYNILSEYEVEAEEFLGANHKKKLDKFFADLLEEEVPAKQPVKEAVKKEGVVVYKSKALVEKEQMQQEALEIKKALQKRGRV